MRSRIENRHGDVMTKRIPEETIEEIRHSVDIVDVISEYVQLKKQGRNYFGLCPLHGEKTPSFSVSAEKQIFHCFGCGAGGNVFTFIMEMEGCSFVDAVVKLSKKTNVVLENVPASAATVHHDRTVQEMLRAHELLQKLYHHLLVNTTEGQKALFYLQQRGLSQEIIKKFQIGYSPNSWNMQTTYLQKRGFSLENMERAGLLIRRQNGEFLDRFRDRIMFPIWDQQGRTVAFGGRILHESPNEPKYMNSPETILYQKGKLLFPMHLARTGIRKTKKIVLFEGYMDVISAWNAGVDYGVATLGTALSLEQATTMKRLADEVIICFDGDNAGKNATLKAAEILQQADVHVEVANLPDNLDPDDYIQNYGPSSFVNNVVGDSRTVMSFKLSYLRNGLNLQHEGDRIRYIEAVLKEIAQLNMAVEIDHYLRQLSEEFSLSLTSLHEQVKQLQQTANETKNERYARGNLQKNLLQFSPKQPLLPAYHKAERLLLAHMLRNEEISWQAQNTIGASFNIDEHNAIAIHLYAFYEAGNAPNISKFIEKVHEPNLKRLVTELGMYEVNDNVSQEEIQDYIKAIQNEKKVEQIRQLEIKRDEAERQNDLEKAAKIQYEIIKMKKELKSS